MGASKKSETVKLRIDADAHELIARAADISGTSVAEFMSEAAVVLAREKLQHRRASGDSADLCDRLAAPGVARETLVRLVENQVDWID